MKPIPTNYHGYRCRSRLEARWIVFFEQMKIEFLYEPEGFEFDDGTRYLPDFYLPQIRFWAEVKPAAFTAEEMCKAENLIRSSGRQLIMLVGPPDFRHHEALTFDAGEVSQCEYAIDIYAIRPYYWAERRLYSDPGEWTEDNFSQEFHNAVYESRSKRFEEVA